MIGEPLPAERWVSILPTDPRPWLLASDEPAARWIAFTALLDRPDGDAAVVSARAAVLADPGTRALVDRIPTWGAPLALPGHDSALFAPNILGLLADMGVRGGDHPRIESTLDAMLDGRVPDAAGEERLATFATSRVTPGGAWSALCAIRTRAWRRSSGTGAPTTHASSRRSVGWRRTRSTRRRGARGRAWRGTASAGPAARPIPARR